MTEQVFLGDVAGVGKGQTVVVLIWKNWQQGRYNAVYFWQEFPSSITVRTRKITRTREVV